MADQPTDLADTPPPASHVEHMHVEPNGAFVTGFSDEAIDHLRRNVEDASGGGNRFVWFVLGFGAALLAGVIASFVFLAVSDEDDDGNVNIDVPAVDLDVDTGTIEDDLPGG